MGYKDKALQKKTTLERVRRYRNKGKGVTVEGVTEEGVTAYRPIIIALADPVKRAKLRKICQSLSGRETGKTNRLDEVYYGCGVDPTPMSEIDELLTAWDDEEEI